MVSPIVLITDFGTKDPYVAVMKGVILSKKPDLNIVDGTHEIFSQDIKQASYFLNSILKWYPPDTVFICVVDPGVGSKRDILVLKINKCIVVAPDNGLLSDVLKNFETDEIYSVLKKIFISSTTFDGRDIFAPLGAELAQKGTNIPCLKKISLDQIIIKDYFLKPQLCENLIIGCVVNIDKFGNLITNISKTDALKVFSTTENLKAFIDELELGKVMHTYSSSLEGSLSALWNSSDSLEIASINSSARKKLCDLSGKKIFLKFFE
jgi:hypothetical protein